MRLLVTRPEPDASAFAQELRELGHDPLVHPLLQFRGLAFDPSPLLAANALIVTSGNGLRALQQRFDLRDIEHVATFCVGEETARRARSGGLRSVTAAPTAEDLAGKIVSSVPPDRPLTHVTGEHQAFDIAGALSREGFSVCTLRVYEMRALDAFEPWLADMMGSGGLEGVILMSPRTADIFVSLCRRHNLLDEAKKPFYFCLAGSVAERLAAIEPDRVLVATAPNRRALTELLLDGDDVAPSHNHDPMKNGR